jgi:putative flavoprotein involved in K+ transport
VNGGFVCETIAGELASHNVVVASGAFQSPRPRLPGAEDAPVDLQLTTSEYRRPEQLPAGAVLVVGGGQSGCQIADELLAAGREVYLAAGRCAWFPRRYRGRDFLSWADELGMLDETVDSLPSPAARLACNPPISGNDGGHDCHPRWLAGRGAHVVGRLAGVEDGVARFEPGVEATLAAGDAFASELMQAIDAYIESRGLDAPPAEERESGPSPIADTSELDLRAHGISTILWASGFRPDYGWIELDVTDEYGWPRQRRGVSEQSCLYFVGVNWLHKRKSALLCGVGEDAEYVVSQLVASR